MLLTVKGFTKQGEPQTGAGFQGARGEDKRGLHVLKQNKTVLTANQGSKGGGKRGEGKLETAKLDKRGGELGKQSEVLLCGSTLRFP